MKEISSMTTDEMAAEIRTYECQLDHGFAFISYSHIDRARVYSVVLGWMRARYNIYIDLDFEKHGSDQHWVKQMRGTLARSTCRLVVCFKSIHYTYSYAALLELLTIRSANTTNRHRGKPLCVDAVTLEIIPSDQDEIPAPLEAMYQEYFQRMKLTMGQRFVGQNETERDTLLKGLEDWLSHMEPGTKARLLYNGFDANQLMENIEETYEIGIGEFFPYIARLIKNWFDSQNLNGNDISPQSDNRDRFAQVKVERVREPAGVPNTVTVLPLLPSSASIPDSVPVPKPTCKAEDALQASPSPQPQSAQEPDPQFAPKVQSVSTQNPDMEIEDAPFVRVLIRYHGSGKNVVIPDGITKIGSCAFLRCNGLRRIIIPDGVKTISDKAFKECSNLDDIVLPESLARIGTEAFAGCKNLESIQIPKGVKSIGLCAFRMCESLTSVTISEGVTEIRYGAFANCTNLKSIQIPKGVISIDSEAFTSCESLASITIPKGVVSIGANAFLACESLTSITIPEGVTKIDSGTFGCCGSLTSVGIPRGVELIGENAFADCEKLDCVTIPKGVTVIDKGAFEGCQNLKTIFIPVSVSLIGENAFADCSSLLRIHTPAQSYAHEYAKKHDIPVKLV